MPVTSRAAALRAELESVLGVPVRMTVAAGTAQLYAPAPDGSNVDVWHRVIATLNTADRWGSTDSHGTPEVWAHITEGQR
ncbi:hypothetical protein [Streptomyces mirabilis]|uniref:hypothetical protein n=1 Tax=Streptomyces mirabilis TaxID=68239 RepID=UPI002258FAA9|nr:hypothetical protein [Streptomyces mirabilis]MCX4607005.1 hypothetical protein [Streptomyces mirabilis]